VSQLIVDAALAGRRGRSVGRLRPLLLAQYTLFGLVVGAQSVLWGEVKASLGLGEGLFGTAMMLTPLAGLIMLLAPGPWRRADGRPLAAGALLVIAAAVLALASAQTLAAFLMARLLAGAGFALLESTANAAALGWEGQTGRRLVGLLYALFSVGMTAGALGAGALLAGSLSYRVILLLLVPGLLAAAAATALSTYPSRQPVQGALPFGLPRGGALVLIGLALAAVTGEALADIWGVIYLRALGVSTLAGSVMFALFNGAMILGRLLNGPLIIRWGPGAVLRGAWLALAAAFALLAVGGAPLSVAAFTLMGLAVAGVVPTVLTLARAREDDGDATVDGVVAAGYLGFVVAPPLVGWLAELLGLLPAMLLVLSALVAAVAGLARRV
jgi:fucose permease